jgi:ribonuclease P protein component
MKKRDIVKSGVDFNKIIKTGKKISNNCYVIYYKDNNIAHSRYGISVGTKLGHAVFRNKYKRKIRMIITTNKEILETTNRDYIVLFRKTGIGVEHKILEEKFIELARKIKEN